MTITIEERMIFITEAFLGGVFRLGRLTVGGCMLAQPTSRLTNLSTLATGEEWQTHSRYPERITRDTEGKVQGRENRVTELWSSVTGMADSLTTAH